MTHAPLQANKEVGSFTAEVSLVHSLIHSSTARPEANEQQVFRVPFSFPWPSILPELSPAWQLHLCMVILMYVASPIQSVPHLITLPLFPLQVMHRIDTVSGMSASFACLTLDSSTILRSHGVISISLRRLWRSG